MNIEKLAVQGRTKVHKSMAASVSSQLLIQMRKQSLKSCFEDFYSRDHRLEYIASVHNIDFIDDAKADNINATWYSLESVEKPLVWIVAGNKSDIGYEKITELVMKKVKAIICVGDGADTMRSALGGYVRMFIEMPTVSDAVQYAFNISKKGDAVMFSPASAVEGKDFNDLGNEFREAVNRI